MERRGDRTVVCELHDTAPLALRIVGRQGRVARVVVVQTAACLLSGDAVTLRVHVGPAAVLELVEVSGTVAHPVRPGGAGVFQHLELEVADGGRLVHHEQPLVLAEGTRLVRRVHVRLAGSACLAHRETVVLGRAGEKPGAAECVVRVERDGRAVLCEALDTRDLAALRSAAVAGDAKVVAGTALFGLAPPGGAPAAAFALSGVDTVLRCVADDALAAARVVGPVADGWGRAVQDCEPDGAAAGGA